MNLPSLAAVPYREFCELCDRHPASIATVFSLREKGQTLWTVALVDLSGLEDLVLEAEQENGMGPRKKELMAAVESQRVKGILMVGEPRRDSEEFAESINRFLRDRRAKQQKERVG